MRPTIRALILGVSTLLAGQALGVPAARGQGSLARGSLGGYGGSMSNLDSGMGMSGPVIPYAGKFGGFMPYRMSGSSSLSFSQRGASAMGSPRAPFSLSPMNGGMSSMGGGMGRGVGAGSSSYFSPRGTMGSSGGMGPDIGGMGVMPPRFGYPFYQPPSFLAPSGAGVGMSM